MATSTSARLDVAAAASPTRHRPPARVTAVAGVDGWRRPRLASATPASPAWNRAGCRPAAALDDQAGREVRRADLGAGARRPTTTRAGEPTEVSSAASASQVGRRSLGVADVQLAAALVGAVDGLLGDEGLHVVEGILHELVQAQPQLAVAVLEGPRAGLQLGEHHAAVAGARRPSRGRGRRAPRPTGPVVPARCPPTARSSRRPRPRRRPYPVAPPGPADGGIGRVLPEHRSAGIPGRAGRHGGDASGRTGRAKMDPSFPAPDAKDSVTIRRSSNGNR